MPEERLRWTMSFPCSRYGVKKATYSEVRLGGARHGTGSDFFIKGIEGDGNAEVFKVFLFVQEEVERDDRDASFFVVLFGEISRHFAGQDIICVHRDLRCPFLFEERLPQEGREGNLRGRRETLLNKKSTLRIVELSEMFMIFRISAVFPSFPGLCRCACSGERWRWPGAAGGRPARGFYPRRRSRPGRKSRRSAR